jgi:hypothetical protein
VQLALFGSVSICVRFTVDKLENQESSTWSLGSIHQASPRSGDTVSRDLKMKALGKSNAFESSLKSNAANTLQMLSSPFSYPP